MDSRGSLTCLFLQMIWDQDDAAANIFVPRASSGTVPGGEGWAWLQKALALPLLGRQGQSISFKKRIWGFLGWRRGAPEWGGALLLPHSTGVIRGPMAGTLQGGFEPKRV